MLDRRRAQNEKGHALEVSQHVPYKQEVKETIGNLHGPRAVHVT